MITTAYARLSSLHYSHGKKKQIYISVSEHALTTTYVGLQLLIRHCHYLTNRRLYTTIVACRHLPLPYAIIFAYTRFSLLMSVYCCLYAIFVAYVCLLLFIRDYCCLCAITVVYIRVKLLICDYRSSTKLPLLMRGYCCLCTITAAYT